MAFQLVEITQETATTLDRYGDLLNWRRGGPAGVGEYYPAYPAFVLDERQLEFAGIPRCRPGEKPWDR